MSKVNASDLEFVWRHWAIPRSPTPLYSRISMTKSIPVLHSEPSFLSFAVRVFLKIYQSYLDSSTRGGTPQ
jgi:hypothetical protein